MWTKAQIVAVGFAAVVDGLPTLMNWHMKGGGLGYNATASGPDDPILGGWTFRELHAIANGVTDEPSDLGEPWANVSAPEPWELTVTP